jgi:peptidyl-prolyl cis-trans isomerase D
VQSEERKVGRTLTPEEAKTKLLWKLAIDRLAGEAAIERHAKDLGITVSDRSVADRIMSRHPEVVDSRGRIDANKYAQSIREAGFRSIPEYERASRRELRLAQLTDTLGAGALPQQYFLDALYRFHAEARVIEFIVPDFTKRVAIAEPSEKQLREFYERNKGKYIAPEERKADVLLLSREAAASRAAVTDEEVKAAYDAAKASYEVPEKRRVAQLTFPDKAAAEKAYAELSKAKDFDAAAAKLGFPAADIDLGLLKRAEMVDPKIADAAFKLKANELSRPVESQFKSVVLLRVTEIQPGKTHSFEEAKAELRNQLAGERASDQIQDLYDKVEAARKKRTPLKEIAGQLKLPFVEVAALHRTGKTADGKAAIDHADAAKIAEAIFGTKVGARTETFELGDGGSAWFDLLAVTPERLRPFEEVAGQVRTDFLDAERYKEMAKLAAKQIERLERGEGLDAIARSLGAKIERTQPINRLPAPPPPGLPALALQEALRLPEGGAASVPTADGKSRAIFRVADVIAARDPTPEQAAALKAAVANQLRIDVVEQYVRGLLLERYGYNIDSKVLLQALGLQSLPGVEGLN